MNDYWLIGLIIFFAVSLIVGPIFMFQPSQRDRRLANLRTAAAQKGIHVRLVHIEFTADKPRELAVYSKSIDNDDKHQQSDWVLLKTPMNHEIHFMGQWDWQERNRQAPEICHPALKKWLHELPDAIYGVGFYRSSIGVYWKEATLTIDEIEQFIDQLTALINV